MPEANLRSNSKEVRNPMLTIPEVQAFAELPPDAAQALRNALVGASKVFRVRANEAWKRHKAPIAAYWKASAVNARHLANAIPKTPKVG